MLFRARVVDNGGGEVCKTGHSGGSGRLEKKFLGVVVVGGGVAEDDLKMFQKDLTDNRRHQKW